MLLPVLPTFTFNFQSYVVEIAVIFCTWQHCLQFWVQHFFWNCLQQRGEKVSENWKRFLYCIQQHLKRDVFRKPKNNYFGHFVNFLSIFTCQSLVVMVVMVDRPTIHCLIPSPSAVVWVWTAEELNISPQVEMICFKIESSPEK